MPNSAIDFVNVLRIRNSSAVFSTKHLDEIAKETGFIPMTVWRAKKEILIPAGKGKYALPTAEGCSAEGCSAEGYPIEHSEIVLTMAGSAKAPVLKPLKALKAPAQKPLKPIKAPAVGLTAIETKLLKAWPSNCDDIESQLNDNCTFTDAKELIKLSGIPMASINGVIASLCNKGFAIVEEKGTNGPDLLVLTEDGIRKYFDIYKE